MADVEADRSRPGGPSWPDFRGAPTAGAWCPAQGQGEVRLGSEGPSFPYPGSPGESGEDPSYAEQAVAWDIAHNEQYQADVPIDGQIGPPWFRLRDEAVREDFAAGGADGSRGPGGENYPWAFRNLSLIHI